MSYFLAPGGQKQDNRIQQYSSYKARHPVFTDWNTKNAIQNGLKASVWVYACIDKIQKAASSVPWYVEKRVTAGEDDWEREAGHPVEVLLKDPNPNPFWTGHNLMKFKTSHLQLGGNAIWYMNMVDDIPVEIWPIMPDQIKPVPSKDGMIEKYEYTVEGESKKIPIPPEEIIHFMFMDPGNPLWGLSPLKATARQVDTDVKAIQWNFTSLDNRAIPDGVFAHEHPLTKEQWEEARKQVREQQQGSDNARTPWVLGAGAKWQQMNMTPAEMDFLNSRKFTMYEIHAAFDVDPLLTGAPDHSGRANKKEAKREFWQDNIIPYLDNIKDSLNNSLMIPFDLGRQAREEPMYRLVYDISNVEALQEDFTEKVRNANTLWRMGVPFNNVNQRLELGFDEVPGGEQPRGARVNVGLGISSAGKPQSSKSSQWSKEEKEIFWRKFDDQRIDWETEIQRHIEDRFIEESEEVVESFEENDIEGAIETIEMQEADWKALFESLHISVIEHFGQQEADRIADRIGHNESGNSGPAKKKQFVFDPFSEAVQAFIARHTAQKVTQVLDTTKGRIRDAVDIGLAEGETSRQIADRVKFQYDRWAGIEDEDLELSRAMTISRTETGSASNYGNHQGAVQAEEEFELQMNKEWVDSGDDRVREEHEFMNGEIRALNERYSNGLMYPGDPDGEAENVISCRCTEIHHIVE